MWGGINLGDIINLTSELTLIDFKLAIVKELYKKQEITIKQLNYISNIYKRKQAVLQKKLKSEKNLSSITLNVNYSNK